MRFILRCTDPWTSDGVYFLQQPMDVCAWPHCPRDRHGVHLGTLLHWHHQIFCVSNSQGTVYLCSRHRLQCSHVTCSVNEGGGAAGTNYRAPAVRNGAPLCCIYLCLSRWYHYDYQPTVYTDPLTPGPSHCNWQSVCPIYCKVFGLFALAGDPNPLSAALVTCRHP